MTYGGMVTRYQYKPLFVGAAKMGRKVTFSCSHTGIFAAEQEFFGWLYLTGLHKYVVLALGSRLERTIRIGKQDVPSHLIPKRLLDLLAFFHFQTVAAVILGFAYSTGCSHPASARGHKCCSSSIKRQTQWPKISGLCLELRWYDVPLTKQLFVGAASLPVMMKASPHPLNPSIFRIRVLWCLLLGRISTGGWASKSTRLHKYVVLALGSKEGKGINWNHLSPWFERFPDLLPSSSFQNCCGYYSHFLCTLSGVPMYFAKYAQGNNCGSVSQKQWLSDRGRFKTLS